MGDIFTSIIVTIAVLIGACFISSVVLAKNTKEFHIHFGLLNGFDISGSFYDDDKN